LGDPASSRNGKNRTLACKLKPAKLSGNDSVQNWPFVLAGRCIILHSWAGELRTPATSNLKRSRALQNCSRVDRIWDGPFNWPR
jgi:hypothetical protein